MDAFLFNKILAHFNCLTLILDHPYKEFVLGCFNHAPVFLWLRIRSMCNKYYFKCHIHISYCNSYVDGLGYHI